MHLKLAADPSCQEREGVSSDSLGVGLVVQMGDVALEEPVEDGRRREAHQENKR